MDGYVQIGENPVDGARGDHEARINCATHDSSQRIPRTLVEPVEETGKYRIGCSWRLDL